MPELKPNQARFLSELLTAATIEQAAARAGISPRTGQRWLADDGGFIAALRVARRKSVESAVTRLAAGMSTAVSVLFKQLKCGTSSVELRAAALVIDRSLAGMELVDLSERLESLEARLGVAAPAPSPSANGRHASEVLDR